MINFVLSRSKNYAQVQSQILAAIKRHLPERAWSETYEDYIEGALNFSLFIGEKCDVIMSHGIADKNYHWKTDPDERVKFNNKVPPRKILVPGQWLRRRIIRSKKLVQDESQVFSVGWPRLDALLELQGSKRSPQSGGQRRPKVLWAPTHDFKRRGKEGVSTSSYPEFQAFLPKLEEYFDVEVSLHPRNRRKKKPTWEQLVEADYVISDFGTIVYEAWALGKPVVFPYWIVGERIQEYLPYSAESYIFKHKIGLHADSIDEVIAFINSNRGLDGEVEQFLGEYLDPEFQNTSARRVAEVLMSLDSE